MTNILAIKRQRYMAEKQDDVPKMVLIPDKKRKHERPNLIWRKTVETLLKQLPPGTSKFELSYSVGCRQETAEDCYFHCMPVSTERTQN